MAYGTLLEVLQPIYLVLKIFFCKTLVNRLTNRLTWQKLVNRMTWQKMVMLELVSLKRQTLVNRVAWQKMVMLELVPAVM